jgi:uncharacterized protein YrrD
VVGSNGKLGEVSRIIVDARSDLATDIVVKHGFVFGRERVVPLSHVSTVADGAVQVDIDEHGLEQMNGFTDARAPGPDPDYTGPPSMDTAGAERSSFGLDSAVAQGSAAGYGTSGKPLGYPGGEPLAPDFIHRPAITRGTDVLDTNGEKVGDLGDVAVDMRNGAVLRLSVRKGFIFTREMDLPAEWVQNVTSEGVVLSVSKERVQQSLTS